MGIIKVTDNTMILQTTLNTSTSPCCRLTFERNNSPHRQLFLYRWQPLRPRSCFPARENRHFQRDHQRQ